VQALRLAPLRKYKAHVQRQVLSRCVAMLEHKLSEQEEMSALGNVAFWRSPLWVIQYNYDHSLRGSARRQRYNHSEKGRERNKRYEKSPGGKMVRHLYNTSFDGRLLQEAQSAKMERTE
jgi:hypothetical protein